MDIPRLPSLRFAQRCSSKPRDYFVTAGNRSNECRMGQSNAARGANMRKAQRLIDKLGGRYYSQSFCRLVRLGERAVPDLLGALVCVNPATRNAVVRVLSSIKGSCAIAGIESRLSDPDEGVQLTAMYELYKAGTSAEHIHALLASDRAFVRSSACHILGWMGVVNALPDILTLADDPSSFVRGSALDSIGVLGASDSVSLVNSKLRSEDYRERHSAIFAIHCLDKTAALPILIAALYDKNTLIRTRVLEEFEIEPDERARHALMYVRENGYKDQSALAARIIAELDAKPPAASPQSPECANGDTAGEQHPKSYVRLQDRERAMAELNREYRRHKVLTAGQLAFLEDCLTDYDDDMRIAAVMVLWNGKPPRAQEMLLGCLTDPCHSVRSIAVSAFTAVEHHPNRAALEALKSDPNDRVRSSATTALARLTYPEGLQDLITHSRDGFSVFRDFATKALGSFDDHIATERLQELTTDPYWTVRQEAANSLSKVNGPTSLPYLMRLRGNDYQDVDLAAKRAIRKIKLRTRVQV